MIFNVQFLPRMLFTSLTHYVMGNDAAAKVLWNLVWKSKWVWGEPARDNNKEEL